MMHIGFTGTRKGMSERQLSALRIYLMSVIDFGTYFHHGDAKGADQQFHDMVRERCGNAVLVAHPCDIPYWRAYCRSDEVRGIYLPLERDRHIVSECALIIAAPASLEEGRGGTWYTVRYAREAGKPVILLDR